MKKINAEKGMHYQARVFKSYVIYGAKREPMPRTPSIRVYDASNGQEYAADKCFPGSIFDWTATDAGLYVAQKASGSSSRVLFATWDQIRASCK